jgi:hypothetical protein
MATFDVEEHVGESDRYPVFLIASFMLPVR